jgi:hypothetical protein
MRSFAVLACSAIAQEYKLNLHLNIFDDIATANLPANGYKLMFERRRVFEKHKVFVGLVQTKLGFRYHVIAEREITEKTTEAGMVKWFKAHQGEALLQKGEVVLP